MSHRAADPAGEVRRPPPGIDITSRAGWASANKWCHLKGGLGILVTGPLPDAGATSLQGGSPRVQIRLERLPASLPIRAQPFKSLPRSSVHAGLLTRASWEMSLRVLFSRHLTASAPRASVSQSLCGMQPLLPSLSLLIGTNGSEAGHFPRKCPMLHDF